MNIMPINQSGYIALMTVLIVGAASLASVTILLLTGAESQKQVLNKQNSVHAQKGADACGEEALQVLHDNTSFVGSGNLTLGNTSCNYTVTNSGGATRSISISATENSVVRKIQINVTINPSNISISSWQDII